jgi:hypothetical protein
MKKELVQEEWECSGAVVMALACFADIFSAIANYALVLIFTY